jgi:CPA2 family monovalent cation:H+ antiporter-2
VKFILLNDILVIFGLAVLVLFVCHRLGISTIVGFLLTGLLAGPHGFGLVKAIEAIEILAEVGVVLLLFTIGLEFSLRNLLRIRRVALLGGGAQVGLTCLCTILLSRAYGLSTGPAVFMGFLVSLSSTAIVMKIFQDRAEVESPHGNTALGILIFQDIIVVPMMLFLPVLAGVRESWGDSFLIFLAEGVGIGIFVLICAKWVVPWILYRVTQTRIHELFLLSVILICLLIAWLTHLIGLSLALGAFLAGLIISESEYSHAAIGNILPFRDLFTSFFFVSIGMLLDLGFFVHRAPVILGITLAVFVLKFILVGFSAILAGLSLRTAILTGMALCQVGEFSFILSKTGLELGVIQQTAYQMFLAVSVITMAFTPFAIGGAPAVAELISRWPLPQRLKRGAYPIGIRGGVRPQDHIIIVGFGINGRNIARAAKTAGVPYVVIEMNPEAVRAERAKGEPIDYGDATQEAVLKHAEIQNARAIVIVINDPTAAQGPYRCAHPIPAGDGSAPCVGGRRGDPRGVRDFCGNFRARAAKIPAAEGGDRKIHIRNPIRRIRNVPQSVKRSRLLPGSGPLPARCGNRRLSRRSRLPDGGKNTHPGGVAEEIRSHPAGDSAKFPTDLQPSCRRKDGGE